MLQGLSRTHHTENTVPGGCGHQKLSSPGTQAAVALTHHNLQNVCENIILQGKMHNSAPLPHSLVPHIHFVTSTGFNTQLVEVNI